MAALNDRITPLVQRPGRAAVAPQAVVDQHWRRRLEREQADVHANTVQWAASSGVLLGPGLALLCADAFEWLAAVPENTFHAIVTDPPYGLLEYEHADQAKLRAGRGGVWRVPPSFDGRQRAPVPRFTVLTAADRHRLGCYFAAFGAQALRVLRPGGHLFLASNPLVSTTTFAGLEAAGFEKRGEVIRLVQTLRGGDRPKGAEDEFDEVTVMPRAGWEPWGLFRKRFEGTVAENLRRWGTGGLRRRNGAEPFRDVIPCSPTRAPERRVAPHPSLKPQRFVRQLVRAALPLGLGVVLDPFAGSGSTVAAAAAVGYCAVGVERDAAYYRMAVDAHGALRDLETREAANGRGRAAS